MNQLPKAATVYCKQDEMCHNAAGRLNSSGPMAIISLRSVNIYIGSKHRVIGIVLKQLIMV